MAYVGSSNFFGGDPDVESVLHTLMSARVCPDRFSGVRSCARVFIKNFFVFLLGLFVAMLFWFVPLVAAAPADAVKTDIREVRVAFFPMKGFHSVDRQGKPNGYDVTYLERVAIYARWNVRYVPVNSWVEALDAVENGRLDLMGATLMNPERARKLEYSALSGGQTREVLLTNKSSSDLVYEDFEAFSGLRVGCMRASIRRADFMSYAVQNGFTPDIVDFNTVQDMRQALHDGVIEAMLVSVLEMLPGERILAELTPAPYFYVATGGATELMAELNQAMHIIKVAEPDFEDRLMAEWYPQTHVFPFSRKELDFIQQQRELTISLLPARGAFSKMNAETGEFEGIVPDILKLLAKESGLSFVFTPLPEDVTPVETLTAGLVPAVAGITRYDGQLKDRRLLLTDAFYTSTIVMLGRKGEPFNPSLSMKVAVQPSFRAVRDFLSDNFPHFTQVFYEDYMDAMEALKNGSVSGMIQNSHLLQPHLQGPRYANLAVVPEVSVREPLAIALRVDTNPLLLSVLNKSIRRLHCDDVRQIVINHVMAEPYVMSLSDTLLHYQQPIKIIALLSVLCLALMAYGIYARRKNGRLIRENEEVLKNITNNINSGVVILSTDDGFRITYANKGFLDLLGYTAEDYKRDPDVECMAFVYPGDVHMFKTSLAERKDTAGHVVADVRMRHSNGLFVPVLLRGTVGQDKQGREVLYCVIMDISEQKNMIRTLELEKERYRVLLEQSSDMVFEYDAAAHFVSCSPRFREAFGLQAQSGEEFVLPLHPDDEPLMETMAEQIRQFRNHAVSRVRMRQPSGSYLWCRLVLSGITSNGVLERVVGRIEDVHAEVLEQRRLESLARRDALCGLLNRKAFRTAVETHLRSGGVEHEGALFFVDIDNFKAVNDNLGHKVGDQALKDVAGALKRLFRDADPVGRYGGDEFFVYAKDLSLARAKARADEINTALRLEYRGQGDESVWISASVGVARNPMDGVTYDMLFEKADQALYKAKSLGKNCAVFMLEPKSPV